MNGIHRNVRIGHLVWGGLAGLCLVLFMVAREQERAALTEQVGEAERRAQLYADTVLRGGLQAPAVSGPLDGASYGRLLTLLEDRMLSDPRIARVRLWSPDGTLLFSTAPVERGKVGRLRVNEDPAITAATGGKVSSRLATVPFTTPGSGDRAAETDLFETFLPLRVADRSDVLGAVQIDQYDTALRPTAAIAPSKTAQWAYLGLAALFGVLTALSFRPRPSVADAGWTRGNAAADAGSAELDSRVDALVLRNEELESAVDAMRVELVDAVTAAEEAERTAADARDEAERRAHELEGEVAAVRHEAQEVADEAQASLDASSNLATSLGAQALELEGRVIAAESRAAEAERRLAELGFEGPPARSNGHSTTPAIGYEDPDANGGPAEGVAVSNGDAGDGQSEGDNPLVPPVTAEAAELRTRLARNAARRKRSPDS